MSDIYLTKIERKTIFTKSLIFVCIMFVICDLTVTGPIWFNFIPWVFLLGLLGSTKKIDSVLMGIIAVFTVFISSILKEGNLNINCLYYVGITFVMLIFGILSGRFIYEFVLEHRLVKYLRPSKKVIYILLIITMCIVSIGLVSIKNGDVIKYIKSRNSLSSFLDKTYNLKEYKIKKEYYINNDYSYILDVQGYEVYLKRNEIGSFTDVNIEYRLNKINQDVNQNLKEKAENVIHSEYKLLEKIEVSFSKEFSKIGLIPDSLTMYVTVKDDSKDVLEELTNYLNKIFDEYNVDKVVVNILENTVTVTKEEKEKMSYDFFINSSIVEDLDEYSKED